MVEHFSKLLSPITWESQSLSEACKPTPTLLPEWDRAYLQTNHSKGLFSPGEQSWEAYRLLISEETAVSHREFHPFFAVGIHLA